ncbi:MAG: DUF4908 domain-containing protein, partial [Caulobacter sp.]|nr:DUF4908 domain-containing protein [Caulobacter sp.]
MKIHSAARTGPGGPAVLLALALAACAGAAQAGQAGVSLRDVFGNRGAAESRNTAAPPVARYVS